MGDELVRIHYTYGQDHTISPLYKRLAVTYAYTHIWGIIYRMGIDSVRTECVIVCKSV